MTRFLLASFLLAAPALVWAQYKCKDERGRTQYVSVPRPGCTDMAGKRVDLSRKAPAKGKSAAKAGASAAAGKAKGAPQPGARKEVPFAAISSDPNQRKVDCRGLQQQRDWLMSPAGRKADDHSARVSQVDRAMRPCR